MTVRCARISALLMIVGLIGSGFAVPVGAQTAARVLTVEPATGLENQVVHLKWSGFHPTVDGANTVTIYQCKGARPTSLSECYKDFSPPVTEFGTATDQAITGADGTGTADFEVRPGLQLPQLGCSSSSPCSILAYENDGSDLPATGLPATAVSTRLDFAPSPSDCPKVSTPDVATEGEGSTASAMYAWSARVCTGKDPLSLDYTESSSPASRDDFLKGLVDVSLTSNAPTAQEIAAGTKRAFTLSPIDLTGVVVAFNVSDTVTHERITDMNLTPRLVAIMIAGGQFGGPGQSLFSDPEFVALNPGHHWPDRVEPPLLRSERNADASILTNWLNSDTAARAFLDGKDRVAQVDPYWKNVSYPTDTFEARDPSTIGSYNPRSGTLTNARRLFNFLPPGDAVISPANDGLMAVMDAVTARKFGFPTAKLRPANAGAKGETVAVDSNGLLAGYRAMKTTPDKLTKVPDSSAAGAYPLVKIDYALVPTSGATKTKAQNIARFLAFAAGGGQAASALSQGYVPLPTDLRAQAATAQRLVVQGTGAPPTTTTPTTQPSTPPATSPPTTPGSISPGAGSLNGGSPSGSFTDNGSSSFGDGSFSSGTSGVGGTDLGGGSNGDLGSGTDTTTGTQPGSTTPPSSALGTTGGDGQEATGQPAAIRPIGKFAGPEGQQVLPLLLGAGVAALTVGPGLSLWVRRKSKKRPKLPVEAVPS